MTARPGPADENLLKLIATKEKELEAKVAQTREQARQLVEEAQRQAENIREQARREAAMLAERTQTETARDTQAAEAERLGKAKAEADRIRSRAAERTSKAVKLVVDHVLAGLSGPAGRSQ